jgi:AcrR family transcriptional regulator
MVSLPDRLKPVPVGREQLSRDVMAEQQRDHVLGAAVGVFAKRGYPATTVDNLVAAARIGVGTFYSFFDGKEDCFLAAFDRVVADARKRIAAAIPADASWPEQAYAALRAALELIAAEPLGARLVLVESQTAGRPGLARYEQTADQLVPLFRRGREHSPIAADLPATLDVATVGGLLWSLQQRIVLGELQEVDRFLPDAVEIAIEPYLGSAATAELLAAA